MAPGRPLPRAWPRRGRDACGADPGGRDAPRAIQDGDGDDGDDGIDDDGFADDGTTDDAGDDVLDDDGAGAVNDLGDDGDDDGGLVPAPAAQAPIVDPDGDPTTDGYRGGEVIVRLNTGADIVAFNTRHGTVVLAAVPARDLYRFRLTAGTDEVAALRALNADADVRWAELNFVGEAPEGRPSEFFVSTAPEPTADGERYAPNLLGVPAAACVTGAGVVVAVIDTGIDAAHPDLAGRVLPTGWNVLTGDPDAADAGNGLDDDGDGLVDEMTGHGSHVAGIVAQVAPEAAILPIKALDSDGVGDAFSLAAAVYQAIDGGARVIHLSLGSTHDARIVAEAVAAATEAGIVVVAAAGNLGRERPPEFPATDGHAIGVAATDAEDTKANFSNFHAELEISAPGTAITSAFPGGGQAIWSGTSMATPFVSGAAALLLGIHPTWTTDDVAARLTTTAVPIDDRNPDFAGKLGAGRLDVGAAVGCGGA